MADLANSLAGLVTLNDKNIADIFPSNVLDDAPLLKVLYAVAASNGNLHKYPRKTARGTAAFRAICSGVANTAMYIEEVTDTLKYLDATVYADVAAAEAYKAGIAAYLELLMAEQFSAGFFELECQILNGVANDASGFVGCKGLCDALTDEMVVNAGGSGSDTMCVYLLRSGIDGVAAVAGNDGKITFDEEPSKVRILDGSSNPYMAYAIPVGGWFGLQVASTYALGAIVNIESAGSSNILTDDMIADAISRFPAGKGPNLIVMNRTALKQLQDGRTATNPTGAPAPFPQSAFNIPIVTTDALGKTETSLTTTTTTTTTTM